jgi:predicted RNA-binding Zn-ribbon protein involved in translation (DUF1610 family)
MKFDGNLRQIILAMIENGTDCCEVTNTLGDTSVKVDITLTEIVDKGKVVYSAVKEEDGKPELTRYEKYEQPGQSGELKLFSCSSCGSVHDFTWLMAHKGDVPNYCPSCGKKIARCRDCDNFIGGGDWNLCCKNPPKGEIGYCGFLCYEDSNACENFIEKEVDNK